MPTYTGTAGDDFFGPTTPNYASYDVVDGLGGNDTIQGYYDPFDPNYPYILRGGAMTIDGGEGNDTLSFNGVYYGLIPVRGFYIGGYGWTYGTLLGGAGDDLLIGNEGPDILDGGTGADTMIGGGTDMHIGGDTFYVDNPGDVVIEASGASAHVFSSLAAYQMPANVYWLTDTAPGNQTLYGNGINDQIEAGNGHNTITTYNGNDTILAGNGGSVVDAGPGNDFVSGGAGDDYFVGGDGNDTLLGYGGRDSLYGGPGDDLLIAGDGPGSVIDGGAGANTLWGGNGNDYLVGGEGGDLMVGGPGSDYLFGNAGDDTLYGGQGTDYIYGNAGNDFIWTDYANFPQSTDYIYEGGGTGVDTIADFTPGDGANRDVLVIAAAATGLTSFAQIQANTIQAGIYTVINLSATDQVYLYNVQPSQLTANDFIFL